MTSSPAEGVAVELTVTVVALLAVSSVLLVLLLRRSRRERALLREQLSSLTSHVEVGSATLALDGRFTMVDATYARLTGYTVPQLLGMRWQEVTHPADIAESVRVTQALLTGTQPTVCQQKRWLHPDGREVWVEMHVSVTADGSGAVTGFVSHVVDISDRKQAELAAEAARQDSQRQQQYDVLTGLPNRTALRGTLQSLCANTTHIAVLHIDVDDFSYVNESLSQQVGDALLVQLAHRLRATVTPEDFVARTGEDHFVVVVPGVDTASDAEVVARAINTDVADVPFTSSVDGAPVLLTVSVGITCSHLSPAPTVDGLLLQAEAALRDAKKLGRNRWCHFTSEMEQHLQRRRSLAGAVRAAARDQSIKAWMQPIVSLPDGNVVGYEALARWITSDGRAVPASEWIGVANETGMLTVIGDQVIEQSIAHLAGLPDPVTVSINAAGSQLAMPGFGERITALLNDYAVDPHRLILEVTEQTMLHSLADTRRMLHALTSQGVRLHLDDFGTGYSSLTNLRALPVTGLKLDRSFLNALVTGERGGRERNLVEGIADLAHRLNLDTIAEGIESRRHAQIAYDCGWWFGQGYWYGKPQDMSGGHQAAPPRRRGDVSRMRGLSVPTPRRRRARDPVARAVNPPQ